MPRTVENIGFYARLGFFPGHLTVTLTNDIVTRGHQGPVLLSQRKSEAGGPTLEAAPGPGAALRPRQDFNPRVLLTPGARLRGTPLVRRDARLARLRPSD